MWIKSNQHFSQLLLLFSSGWHSRIQPGHHEIWKGLLFTRDYQYEWAGTAKMFHSCLENKLRLSVPAQHLEKILPSKRVWGSSRCGASSFYRSASARWWGPRTHLFMYIFMGLCLCYAKPKKTLRFCCCCRFEGLCHDIPLQSSHHYHSRCVYDLRGPEISGLPPGMASITRPPDNIQNAQGLGRSTLASSGIYLQFGSLKDAANWFLKLLKDFSNLFKDTSLFNYQWSSIKINLIHLWHHLWHDAKSLVPLILLRKYKFIMNIQDFSAKPFLCLFFQSDIPGFSPPSVSDSVSPLPKQRAVRRCTCLDESLDESGVDFSWWLPKMMAFDYWMV